LDLADRHMTQINPFSGITGRPTRITRIGPARKSPAPSLETEHSVESADSISPAGDRDAYERPKDQKDHPAPPPPAADEEDHLDLTA
jgi:hypothetical protein